MKSFKWGVEISHALLVELYVYLDNRAFQQQHQGNLQIKNAWYLNYTQFTATV